MIPKHLNPRMALLFALGGCQGLIGWWMVKSGLDNVDQNKEIRVSPYRLATHLGTSMCVYVHVCMYVCLYIYMYVCIYVCTSSFLCSIELTSYPCILVFHNPNPSIITTYHLTLMHMMPSITHTPPSCMTD